MSDTYDRAFTEANAYEIIKAMLRHGIEVELRYEDVPGLPGGPEYVVLLRGTDGRRNDAQAPSLPEALWYASFPFGNIHDGALAREIEALGVARKGLTDDHH